MLNLDSITNENNKECKKKWQKKHKTLTENPLVQIYPNKIKNNGFQNKDRL